MKLYQWQEDCLQTWIQHNRRGIADVITGAGKTVLALACISSMLSENLRVRIVVPTVSLAAQWLKTLQEQLPAMSGQPVRAGIICGIRKDSPDNLCTIYVINSARDVISRHILTDMVSGRQVFLIADECHRCTSKENRRIFDFLLSKDYRRDLYCCLGLSATAVNAHYRDVLVPALGGIIYHYDYAHALPEGIISPFLVFQVGLHFYGDEMKKYLAVSERLSVLHARMKKLYSYLFALPAAEFFMQLQILAEDGGEDSLPWIYRNILLQRAQITRNAASRKDCLFFLIDSLPELTSVIVFCERIEQAEEITRVLEERYPGRVAQYHSDLSKDRRKTVLDLFRCSEYRILVCCRALDEGLDVPDASVGVIVSGTGVERQRIQRLGRILRRSTGKDFAKLYYYYVKESTEDSAFLADRLTDIPVFNMELSDGVFRFPEYELYAEQLLIGAPDRYHPEIRACIAEGILKTDWLLPPSVCHKRFEQQSSTHSRNYWLCMERISRMYQAEQKRTSARLSDAEIEVCEQSNDQVIL